MMNLEFKPVREECTDLLYNKGWIADVSGVNDVPELEKSTLKIV